MATRACLRRGLSGGAPIDGSARDVLAEAEEAPSTGGGAVGEASTFLRSLLAEGPIAVSDIKREATAAGLSWGSVRRAQTALGIVARKSGFGGTGRWEWELPTQRGSTKSKDAQQKNVSTFDKFEHLSANDVEVEI